jgi:hypothetical protein
MKLGHVWDLKLTAADDERVKEVFRIAAGEMSLEAFLKEIRDYWEPFQLSIVSYKARGKVVKGVWPKLVCAAVCLSSSWWCVSTRTRRLG